MSNGTVAYRDVLEHHATIERRKGHHSKQVDRKVVGFLNPQLDRMLDQFYRLSSARDVQGWVTQADIPNVFGVGLLVTAAEYGCVPGNKRLKNISEGDLGLFVQKMRLGIVNGICLNPLFPTRCKVLSMNAGVNVYIKEIDDTHCPWTINCPIPLRSQMDPTAKQQLTEAIRRNQRDQGNLSDRRTKRALARV